MIMHVIADDVIIDDVAAAVVVSLINPVDVSLLGFGYLLNSRDFTCYIC